jgi:RNA recognition motif-containing protein
MEKEQEEQGGVKFIKYNNLFKYFEFFEINKEKSLMQNYDDYLNICSNNNQIKSIKEICPIAKPLLISNLDYALSENEIKNYLISKYGSIKSIKFLTNRDTNKFNGRAILEFNNISSMNSILNNNGKDKLNDRIIKVVLYTHKNQLNNNNTHNNFHNNINIINNNITTNNNLRTADCWFCYDHNEKLDTKYIIKSFNNFYVAYSKGPIDKYHFLLIPKKHISSFIELSKDEKIEAEMIIQLIQDYLESKDCSYILFEKNLKYNFSNPLHMLINICGFQKALIEKINVFTENFLIEEKMNDFIVSFNEKFLDCYNEKNEYIYINIPKIYKQKIIRKIIFIKTKEYKIDYPRKLICNLINKEERLNWKNTVDLGEEYLKEVKSELKIFLDEAYE